MHTPRYRAYFITARYKDNPGMKDSERVTSRIATLVDEARTSPEQIDKILASMVARIGYPGQRLRFYKSLNLRDGDKLQRHLMHSLIDNEMNMAKMPSKIVSLAMQPGCALEKQWLIDIDPLEDSQHEQPALFEIDFEETVFDIEHAVKSHFPFDEHDKIVRHATPNGYALVVPHGFDTRELINKFGAYVTVKKDALLFQEIKTYEDWIDYVPF